jgi:hypothetical protein
MVYPATVYVPPPQRPSQHWVLVGGNLTDAEAATATRATCTHPEMRPATAAELAQGTGIVVEVPSPLALGWIQFEIARLAAPLELTLDLAGGIAEAIGRTVRMIVVSGLPAKRSSKLKIDYRCFDVSPARKQVRVLDPNADKRCGLDEDPAARVAALLSSFIGTAPPHEQPVARHVLLHAPRFIDSRLATLATQLRSAKDIAYEPQPDGRVMVRAVMPDGSRRQSYVSTAEAELLRGRSPAS